MHHSERTDQDEKHEVHAVINHFFQLFDNRKGVPTFDQIEECCFPEVSIVKKTGEVMEIWSLTQFLEPRIQILTDGTLEQFSEWEISSDTRITGNIGQHYSLYEKKGLYKGKPYAGRGNKCFHLLKQNGKWKIIHLLWEDITDVE